MKKVLLTGSKGTIGTAIQKQLPEYPISGFDLPEHDVRNYDDLSNAMRGHEVVIHLAWNAKIENYKSESMSPDNALMTFNVYKAAIEAGVPRVIMASSVHADDFREWKGPGLMSPYALPVPCSPYGASKVFMEALGRYYATKGLQVVCIRFGGVRPNNEPSPDSVDRRRWCSHRDCGELIKVIIEAPSVPNNFAIVYGISNNIGRIYDISNPFGWVPKDGG